MDYFQPAQQQRNSHQQGNNGGGNGAGNNAANQQYHPYNGLTQQNNQNSNMFYQSSQQQQHLQQQTPYFQIQPASAPLDAQPPYHQSNQQQQQQPHQNSHNNSNHSMQHQQQQTAIYGNGGGSAQNAHQQQQRRSGLMNQNHHQQHHGQQQQNAHHHHQQQQQSGQQHSHHQQQQYQQRSNHNQHHQSNHHHQQQQQSGSGHSPSQPQQQQQHSNTYPSIQTGSLPPPPLAELPVRIAIDSKHVGAVIGQGGNQIRIITKDSHAKVVVETEKGASATANKNGNRQDHHHHQNSEKVINIIGTSENCTKAVVKILEVVQREISKDNGDLGVDVELKIRAHDPLVGRLIGKQGATIKQIMHETGTQIAVSKISNESYPRGEGTLPLLERTITVHGQTIDCVAQAEAKISAKLKRCHEVDVHHRIQAFQTSLQRQAGSSINPLTSPSSATDTFGSIQRAQSAAAAAAGIPPLPFPNDTMKCLRIWVPDNMVGALIGAKGKHIKQIIRESQANVKIDSPEEKLKRQQEMNGGSGDSNEQVAETSGKGDENEEEKEEKKMKNGEKGDEKEENNEKENEKEEDDKKENEEEKEKKDESDDGENADKSAEKEKKVDERMVTITGSDLQLLRAQQMIYEKMSEQIPQQFGELKLRTEISVPSKIVGRIIGRGGQNVRELQRITGATVKIPEEEKNGPQEPVYKEKTEEGTTVIRIIGNVHASHNVQFRLSQLVADHARNEKRKDANGADASNTSSGSPPPAPSSSHSPQQSPIEIQK